MHDKMVGIHYLIKIFSEKLAESDSSLFCTKKFWSLTPRPPAQKNEQK